MLLEIKNLCKYFYIKEHFYLDVKQIVAFKDINLSLKLGEKLNLKGANGSGKTTLVKTIAMLENYDNGEIIFQNKLLKNLKFSEKQSLRNDLILIMQNQKSALNPYKNIKWHFEMLTKNYNVELDEKMLDDFYLDKSILNLYPHELSGGQAQIIGFLRGLLVNPKLLILDEADAGLSKDALKVFIKYCQNYQNSMILISHDKQIAEQICNVSYEMNFLRK